MTEDELRFFDGMPQMLPVYETLMETLENRYPELSVKVTRTQISLRNRCVFAMASLPWRKLKGWPEEYLMISFGLSYKKEASRIVNAVEAYPNRWTHHVITQRPEDIDEELLDWLDEAYEFSMRKLRGR